MHTRLQGLEATDLSGAASVALDFALHAQIAADSAAAAAAAAVTLPYGEKQIHKLMEGV